MLTLSILLLAAPAIPSGCSPAEVDSYCALYTKMLDDDKDVAAAVKLPSKLKKRLLVNEQLYHAVCPQAPKA